MCGNSFSLAFVPPYINSAGGCPQASVRVFLAFTLNDSLTHGNTLSAKSMHSIEGK